MKLKSLTLSAVLIACSSAYSAVSISGSAINNLDSADVGKSGILYVDSLGIGFSSLLGPQSSIPSSFINEFEGSVTSSIFGNAFAINPTPSIDLTGDVNTGDAFGIVLFDTSSSYRVYTNPAWELPSDGGSLTLTESSTTDGSVALGTGSIVPEPSMAALLAGFLGSAAVILRRRR